MRAMGGQDCYMGKGDCGVAFLGLVEGAGGIRMGGESGRNWLELGYALESMGMSRILDDERVGAESAGPATLDLRSQPTDQDPMVQHDAGFLARSGRHPERVAGLEDWLAGRMERG